MDGTIVYTCQELAYQCGYSLSEMIGDVREHSDCGIELTLEKSGIKANAQVEKRWTKIRSLIFPFTMGEFEVLLRTVEYDARSLSIFLLSKPLVLPKPQKRIFPEKKPTSALDGLWCYKNGKMF